MSALPPVAPQLVDDHVVLALPGLGLDRGETQPVDALAVDPLDPEDAAVHIDLVPDLGNPIQLVGDEAGHRLVLGVDGHFDPRPLDQLVRSQRRVEDHRATVTDGPGPGPVVLVA